jgi:hypothetical protein
VSLIRAPSAQAAPVDVGRGDPRAQAVAEPGLADRILFTDALAMLAVSTGLFCLGLLGIAATELIFQREDLP